MDSLNGLVSECVDKSYKKLRSLGRMYLGKHKHRLKLKRKTLLRISMLAKILRPELAYIH